MFFTKCLVLVLSFTASSSAHPTLNIIGHSHHHGAIAARGAEPALLDVPNFPLRKRQIKKRCKQCSSSVQGETSTCAFSSFVFDKPTPSTAAAPLPSSTTAHAPAPTTKESLGGISYGNSSNPPSFLVGTQTGHGTFFTPGLSACGVTNAGTDLIAAVSDLLFDNFPGYNGINPNNNPLCGRKVTATYQGKSVTVTLTDRCTACALSDLDFSPSAFNQLADPSVGRISGMTWVWDST